MTGQQPFMGGSGPSQNDAIMANQIRQRQAAGLPVFPIPPHRVLRWNRAYRMRHLRKAIYWAIFAGLFVWGGWDDIRLGHTSTSLGPFVIAFATSLWVGHHLLMARPPSWGP